MREGEDLCRRLRGMQRKDTRIEKSIYSVWMWYEYSRIALPEIPKSIHQYIQTSLIEDYDLKILLHPSSVTYITCS